MNLGRELAAAVDAARPAGELLRTEFHRPGGPRGEGDHADADSESEQLIHDALTAAFPDYGFNGEELRDLRRERAGQPAWLVDPNDGTRAFLKGYRGSSVSIRGGAAGRPAWSGGDSRAPVAAGAVLAGGCAGAGGAAAARGWDLRLRILCGLLLCCASAKALVSVRIQYSALEKIVAGALFTQDGRRYVRGNQADRCNFAYLEKPHIAASGSNVLVKARFSGRSARSFFGLCVGLGDDFDVAITAVPYYRNGAIALRSVKVESPGRDGFYIRRVRSALGQALGREFEYKLGDEVKKMVEAAPEKAPYRQELVSFQVSEIRVQPDALELVLDFTLLVK